MNPKKLPIRLLGMTQNISTLEINLDHRSGSGHSEDRLKGTGSTAGMKAIFLMGMSKLFIAEER